MVSFVSLRQSPLRFGKSALMPAVGLADDKAPSSKAVVPNVNETKEPPEIEFELPSFDETNFVMPVVIGKDDHPDYVAFVMRLNQLVEKNFTHMSANARAISDTMRAIIEIALTKLKEKASKPVIVE
jgi:hypothetical protein